MKPAMDSRQNEKSKGLNKLNSNWIIRFDYGLVIHENLEGENKQGKICELVIFMYREMRLPDLVKKCQKLKTTINERDW